MLHKRVKWLAGAAVVAANLAGGAWAVEQTSLDASDSKVREIVADAKESIRQDQGARLPGAPVAAAKAAAAEDQIERRIVVFKRNVPGDRRQQVVRANGGSVVKDLRLIRAVSVVVPKASFQNFEGNLETSPEVERIEEDIRQNWLLASPAAVMPAPPVRPPHGQAAPGFEPLSLRDRQTQPWGVEEVNAQRAWSVTRGQGIKVAVVDTGVDATHPDLRVVGGVNVIEQGGSYIDDNGHGTHVAGTIAGMDNRQGVVGVAPEVNLYAVKVLDADGSGTFSDVIAGIQWCAENGMQVANFSLGASRGTKSLEEAVAAAAAAGVTIVAAAGNSGGDVGYPAAYPGAIAVAATDINGAVADFSSRGPQVAVAAPGVDVLSTYPGGIYRPLSGTSMATPHVAGLAALAIAARGLRTPQEVRIALTNAAKPMDGVPAEQQGAGIPDASRLVQR